MSDQPRRHITAFDVMRFVDSEMSAVESEALHFHLSGCRMCREILLETQAALRQLPEVIRTAEFSAPGKDSAQTKLHIALDQMSGQQRRNKPRLTGILHASSSMRYVAAVLLIALTAGLVARWHRAHLLEPKTSALPDRTLTPGAVRAVALGELCTEADDDDLDPVVALPLQKAVFHEYGIPSEAAKEKFQMDYLINPQLGGSNDVRNLWPQPYSSEWNARAKDELERRLHQMVCERKIELADAQRDLAENWIDAYKKYFHTSKPI